MPKETSKTGEETEKEEKIEKNSPVESSKKKNGPVSRIKFIGFFRHSDGGPWTMLPQMLASEESVKNKINFLRGECESYIIEVDLPQ